MSIWWEKSLAWREGERGARQGAQRPAAAPPVGLCTLTGVSGQPGSDADLQHFVASLRMARPPKPWWNCTAGSPLHPGTPVLLFQLDFKPVTSVYVRINKERERSREKVAFTDPSLELLCKNKTRLDHVNQSGAQWTGMAHAEPPTRGRELGPSPWEIIAGKGGAPVLEHGQVETGGDRRKGPPPGHTCCAASVSCSLDCPGLWVRGLMRCQTGELSLLAQCVASIFKFFFFSYFF